MLSRLVVKIRQFCVYDNDDKTVAHALPSYYADGYPSKKNMLETTVAVCVVCALLTLVLPSLAIIDSGNSKIELEKLLSSYLKGGRKRLHPTSELNTSFSI